MSSLVAEGGRRVVTKTSASSITATSGVEICSRNSSKRIVGTKESGVSSSSSTSVTTTPQVVSSSSQLPSPLPSPPPPLLSSSSSLLSISGATKQSRLNSDPIQLVISHSTPPQSPFMLDEKQATTPFSLNRTTNTNSITTTTNTTHLATTTATGDAGGTPPDESGVIVAAAAAAVSSTVVSNDSTVEAHTPPESNDGTETQIRLAELKNKLARFNVLNAAFQRDLSLNASALDTSRRRLRDIHVATFNRHVAAYLDHKQQSMDDQVVGDEIAYELARRKDDDRKDHGYDDDDQVSTSSSSSSSEDECDDQLIVDTESRGLENDFYFRTTGDVHCSAQLTDQSADDYWNLRRVRLGGEWERVQAKMKYLKHTNEQLDKYLASEREIEKLSRSLKQSLKQTFSASSTSSLLDDDEDEGVSADDELDQPKQQQQQQQQKEDETSRRVICHQRPASARHQQTHSFDELTLLKSFYVTLMHFRTSLFKRTCMCDEENATNRRPTASRRRRQQQQQQQFTSLDKTCIFCHMFKKYDSHLVQSRPTASVPDTQFIRADERVIRLYHSYCKQPKYGDKLNWSTKGETIKTSTRRRNHLDDYYELSRLVNDRLSKLLERRSAGIKLENEPMDESLNAKPYQKREVELDNIDIDPGYEISLDDIKKLPDFSYEELKFLCEDTGDDENNLMDGNKRKELDSVVVVDQNVENSSASKRLRHSR